MTQAEALQNLPQLFTFWLQDEINNCVAGHASRIERLETVVAQQAATIENMRDTLVDTHRRLYP